jgi:hypothetical protein
MGWLTTLYVYRFSIVAAAASFFAMIVLDPLQENSLTASIFEILRWVPFAGLGYSLLNGGWMTYRLLQAERGDGLLCPHCGGPLGLEKYTPYSPHRTCLRCGRHANERHYN